MPKVSVLIPTYNRACALAATLTSLCFQEYKDFDVIISDQSDLPNRLAANDAFNSVRRILEHHENTVRLFDHLPRKGMAEHREFMTSQSKSKYSLFLDDDIILEPWAVRIMVEALDREQCAFVGMGIIGLGYKDNIDSLKMEPFEFWQEKVEPEKVRPDTPAWERKSLHTAANPYYLAKKYSITPENWRLYKIAWAGACCLYDTKKLREAGGFSFWEKLPTEHAGEDVFAQVRLMEKYGGCGILPSGAYHQEQQTSIPNREVDAPKYLKI